MKTLAILGVWLAGLALCLAPPAYGPFPTGTGGGLSSNEVYSIALSVGGPTNGISASTATNIVNNNNAATATTATSANTATAATFAARAPAQMPSSLFSAWNSGTLLLSLSGSGNEVSHLSEASIGSIGTKYGLFYSSYDSGTTGRISAAYGSLLNGFVKHGVVLAPTAASWDSGLIGGVTHFRENGTNYLYYFGGTNFGAFEAEPLHAGVAYSTDGTNYTKYASNPIMTVEQVGGSCITVYTWFTKRIATGYLGFFNAKHSSGVTERIHLASATNPLGPWTYVGEIYHHTNATVTSDFTVADLSEGGYIGAYWIITNGFARSSFAFSDNLTNWVPAGNGPASAFVGGRFFYDDGLAYSYCLSQTAVYYTRPKKSNQGAIEATTVSATSFSGDGSAVSGVTAQYLGSFGAGLNGSDYYLYADVVGGLNDPNLWIYNDSTLRWRSPGGIISGGGFIGSAAGLTNAASGLFSGIVISTNTGSLLNAVGFTNGNVTIPGTLSVSGTTTAGTLYSPSISGDGLGITNAVDLIAGNNITITTNANKRSFTIDSTGGTSGALTNNETRDITIYGDMLFEYDGNESGRIIAPWATFTTIRALGNTMAISNGSINLRLNYVSGDVTNFVFTGAQVIADGSGITNINAANISGDLTLDSLTATTLNVDAINGNGAGITNSPYALFHETLANNVASRFIAPTAWTNVIFTTNSFNSDTAGAFTQSNSFLIVNAAGAGTWKVRGNVVIYNNSGNTGSVTPRLYRWTDSSTLVRGLTAYQYSYNAVDAAVVGVVTLTAGDILGLQVFAANTTTTTVGRQQNSGIDASSAYIEFERR